MPAKKTPAKKRRDRTASLYHERTYHRAGYRHIAGMDEAGRGPLAGPVAAAMVALPIDRHDLSRQLKGVKDSKDMTPAQREETAERIKEVAIAWGIGSASPQEITDLNLNRATRLAMTRALVEAKKHFDFQPDCIFVDYMPFPDLRDVHLLSMVEGDKHSLSIAAASVLAKTWRDEYMVEMATSYPQYGFEQHKGYGTAAHLRALREHGITPLHRLSYAPVQKILQDSGG